ncbi:putative major facilitator superfamily transporter [Vibrio halioticoli NBRC 102217]|uniref:Putative major facilitator superfamily transporter n=1 Tax=Vibrio halioticoli NBRC 102217 TaxID=1219072 RepID=V5FH57_9VIBR|nr:OFA family MFS transporter [Vibrio halioticoli]GAD89206.1 putative major facilitator superfamily transporter [Vibrio halioticoli NBRC 102217]
MSTTLRSRDKWSTLLGTVLIEFALGSVYTWSLFNAHLADKLDEPVKQVAFSFGLLSLALAVASSLSGKLQERFGIKKVIAFSGLLLGASLYLTSVASSLTALYVCAGFLVGFADGTGYLLALTNCIKFFPNNKGIASACAIGAYGLGSLGFKYINMYSLTHFGLSYSFEVWGVTAMVLVLIGAMLVKDAPKQTAQNTANAESHHHLTLQEVLRKPQFYMLALMFTTVCMSGLYAIGIAKDIGQNYVHLSMDIAATAVSVIAVANLGGRVVLGVLSDKITRVYVITIALVICLAGVSVLMFIPPTQNTFYWSLACIAFSFGGTITVYPSLVSDFFGLEHVAKNYGLIYLGFGIGSFAGSVIASLFGGFLATFHVMLALIVISIVLSIIIKKPNRQIAIA